MPRASRPPSTVCPVELPYPQRASPQHGGNGVYSTPPSRRRRRGLLRIGLVPQRLGERRLLLARKEVDAGPAADFLAELAADAGLLVDGDLAEELGPVLRRRVDAVEGADVDAHAAAVAVVGGDERDRAP